MRHSLLIGSRGADVKRLKALLNKRLKPSPKLVVNEVFDKQTDTAVKLFG